MARLRTPAASLQCNNLTMFQLYLQKTQESILQQLIFELKLEILALAQEINVARLLLGSTGSSDTYLVSRKVVRKSQKVIWLKIPRSDQDAVADTTREHGAVSAEYCSQQELSK